MMKCTVVCFATLLCGAAVFAQPGFSQRELMKNEYRAPAPVSNAQQRRDAVREAMHTSTVTTVQNGAQSSKSRKFTEQERAELRQQLRQQRRDTKQPTS